MAAIILAAAKIASRPSSFTSSPRPLSVRFGSPPAPYNLSSRGGRLPVRRAFSSEEQNQIDQIKNEIAELKLAVRCSGEKQKTFEATTRYEINQSELANLKTTLTLIGLLWGYGSIMICLYQLAPSEAEGPELVLV